MTTIDNTTDELCPSADRLAIDAVCQELNEWRLAIIPAASRAKRLLGVAYDRHDALVASMGPDDPAWALVARNVTGVAELVEALERLESAVSPTGGR